MVKPRTNAGRTTCTHDGVERVAAGWALARKRSRDEKAIRCSVCRGSIKAGVEYDHCRCGRVYHPVCIRRTGACGHCENPYPADVAKAAAPSGEDEKEPCEREDEQKHGQEQFTTLTTDADEVVRCSICFGYIKHGGEVIVCACGKHHHPACIARIGECPSCLTTYPPGAP